MNDTKRDFHIRTLCAMTAAALTAGLAMNGCGRAAPGGGPDIAYLTRQADAPKMSPGPYFPITSGSRWTLVGTVEDRPITTTIRVAGTRKVGGAVGTVLETRVNDKPVQQEIYAVSARGVDRLAGGRWAENRLVPPMPLLRFPLKDGDTYAWRGVLRTAEGDAPARAHAEVTGPETIQTPAKKTFRTYRVDLLITITVGARTERIPSSLWFAPEVGMVKQETSILNRQARSVLKDYAVR